MFEENLDRPCKVWRRKPLLRRSDTNGGIMYVMAPSYGLWKFSRESIESRARSLLRVVDEVMDECEASHLVVQGTSGIVMAVQLQAMGCKWPWVLTRKAGESSHGYNVEGWDAEVTGLVILDDLIASGATVRAIEQAIDRESVSNGGERGLVKGILLHGSCDDIHTPCRRPWGYNEQCLPVWA